MNLKLVNPSRAAAWRRAHTAAVLLAACLFIASTVANAQQFNGENQWVAPHGVATLVGVAGEDYSQFIATAALIPEYEFNIGFTHYYDDPADGSGSYTANNRYVKKRLSENEAGTAGYALMAGTGLWPEHLEGDEVSSAGESWWVNGVATYSFNNDQVSLDLLPGVVLNTDKGQDGEKAWGFTYVSRLAIAGVIPQSSTVAEVFGTAGAAYAEPSYRFELRWDTPKLDNALTFSDSFDGPEGTGMELGFMYLTEPRICWAVVAIMTDMVNLGHVTKKYQIN